MQSAIILGSLPSVDTPSIKCVQCIPRSNETDYTEIINDSNNCYSDVGRTGGKQIISLTEECCADSNTIRHEFMHALGFFHEHTHYDRNEWIITEYNNLENFQKEDFDVHNTSFTTTFGTRYDDYASVMHYPPVIDGKRVMRPKYPGITIKEEELSKTDTYKIQRHYGCVEEDDENDNSINKNRKIEPKIETTTTHNSMRSELSPILHFPLILFILLVSIVLVLVSVLVWMCFESHRKKAACKIRIWYFPVVYYS